MTSRSRHLVRPPLLRGPLPGDAVGGFVEPHHSGPGAGLVVHRRQGRDEWLEQGDDLGAPGQQGVIVSVERAPATAGDVVFVQERNKCGNKYRERVRLRLLLWVPCFSARPPAAVPRTGRSLP